MRMFKDNRISPEERTKAEERYLIEISAKVIKAQQTRIRDLQTRYLLINNN